MSDHQAVVIGAGPSGIAAALALKDAGLRPLVLDRADEVGASWRGRYDRLRLNSSRGLSHLPGRSFAKGTPLFPSREDMIAHLERHAHEDGIELRLGTDVARVDRGGDEWILVTSAGAVRTRELVVATGYEHAPFIPAWSGRDAFGGQVVHSSEYRNPEPFRGRRVLVVGSGCSGMEIAYDLAEGGADAVWLSARTPPNIVLRSGPAGLPGDRLAVVLQHCPVRFADSFARFGRRMDMGDLTAYGLPIPEEGVFSRLKRLGVAPAIVDKEVIEAIKARRFEVLRGVESLDATGVNLADGKRVEPDVIVSATGYRRGLEHLVGHLGVLNERGIPRALGKDPVAPGLRFLGYLPRPGSLGYNAKQAKRVAKAIARELRDARGAPPRARSVVDGPRAVAR